MTRAAVLDTAAMATAATIAVAQSWLRWLDPVVDTGRDLYIAEAIGRGAVLYRDIRYEYPPLAPYLLAGITRFTGHSLAAYAAIGFAQAIAIAVLLWFIANRLGGRRAALGATLLFIGINATGATTFGSNFIFPYSHAATFGMLFLLACVACVVAGRVGLALPFALAAMWCKVEYAIAVGIALAACVTVQQIRRREAAIFVAAVAATVAIAIAIFGAARLGENVFANSLTSSDTARHFFAVVFGAASWRSRLVDSLAGLVIVGVVALLIRRGLTKAALAVGIVAALVAPIAIFFRACGVLQWLALARPRDRWLFVLAALSVASTLRIALNVAPIWYGFALILPLYLLIAYATRGHVVWVSMMVVLCGRGLWEQHGRYAAKDSAIVTPRGTFYDSNADRAEIITAAIPHLRGGSAAVFPEGIALNYLADAPTTLTFHTFTPVETKDPRIEERILAEMAARPPDRVVLLQRDLREYGARQFGLDYNQRLLDHIMSHYAMETEWTSPGFYLQILKRRGTALLSPAPAGR